MDFPKFLASISSLQGIEGELIALLDGYHSIQEIYSILLARGFDLNKIHGDYLYLYENGLLEDSIPLESEILTKDEIRLSYNQIVTFSLFNSKKINDQAEKLKLGLSYQENLKKSNVFICGNHKTCVEIENKLKKSGIENVFAIHAFNENLNTAKAIDLFIYISDSKDEENLLRANEFCVREKIPFLPVIYTDFGIETGPLYVPDETSCYMCLLSRRKAAMGDRYQNLYENAMDFNFPVGTDYIIIEAIKFLSKVMPPSLFDQILQVNFITGTYMCHSVLRLPRCLSCGVNKLKPGRKIWEEVYE